MMDRVEDLIDPYTVKWDEALIHDVFSPVDARRIMLIPFPLHILENTIACHYTRSGTFSVRSSITWSMSINMEGNRKLMGKVIAFKTQFGKALRRYGFLGK